MALEYSVHPDVTTGMIAGNTSYPEALGNAPWIQIFDGVMPTDAATALSGNNKLVELPCANTPIASSTISGNSSRAIWAAIASAIAALTGTAAFFRTVTNDKTKTIDQGKCGLQGDDTAALILSTLDFTAGSTIAVSSRTSDLDFK